MCDEDEQLVRYYFDELPGDERAEFERRLTAEPALALRLKTFGECVESHSAAGDSEGAAGEGVAGADAPEPLDVPERLADRTCNAILAGHWERATECVGSKRYSLIDVAAVGVIATLMGMLIFPAITTGREASRRVACANNFHEIYQGLAEYRDGHGSRYPVIDPADNAGMFTVALADGGYLDRDLLERLLVCPSSELGRQVADGRLRVVVPTERDLQAATAAQLWQLRRLMAGSYAYRIGYMQEGRYVFPKCQLSCYTALLADAPLSSTEESLGSEWGTALDGETLGESGIVSRNHGPCGQNVLFQDGHVAFRTGCWAPDRMDHLYLNDASQIAAGRHPDDVVLAPSEATPLGVWLLGK